CVATLAVCFPRFERPVMLASALALPVCVRCLMELEMAEFAAVLGQPLVLDAPDAERVTDVWTVRVDAAARCARLEPDLFDRSLVMTVADPTQLGAGVHSRPHPRWDRCLA